MFPVREVRGEGVIKAKKVGIEGEDGWVWVLSWVWKEVGGAKGAGQHVNNSEPDVKVES